MLTLNTFLMLVPWPYDILHSTRGMYVLAVMNVFLTMPLSPIFSSGSTLGKEE